MKRYFDLPDKRQCAELTIDEDSEASCAPESSFDRIFRTCVREISRQEYNELKSKYSDPEVCNDSRSKG